MPTDHPFQSLFETFGKLPDAHSEKVNREAREKIKSWLDVPLGQPGHCILLKAPRAGHGKTHLLTRLQHELGGSHEFIPLHAIGGSRIDAATVMDDVLRRLVRGLPAAGGLTVLDLVARRLFSIALQPLVNSGEVPCQDREGALNALKTRPIETFDFHHPDAVTAQWARENFELLGPRLSLELSQRNSLSMREVSFWVDAMFRFAATAIDNPGRSRALAVAVFSDPASEAVAHERLIALLGLMTSLMRVILVADEVEGFSSDETAALRFASFLGALRQSVSKVDVILSVNQDVWESAFLPRLSGGLADRLSEVTVELEPLDREMMLAILESRSEGYGEKILAEMDTEKVSTHARGLIKQAGAKWTELQEAYDKKGQTETTQPSPPAGEDEDPPEVEEELQVPDKGQASTPLINEDVSVQTQDEASNLNLQTPPRDVTQSGFSAEAAIAAFRGTVEAPPESKTEVPDREITASKASKTSEPVAENPPPEPVFQASSWPSPVVEASRFHASPSEPEFSPAPPSTAPPAFQEAGNSYQAAPAPASASVQPPLTKDSAAQSDFTSFQAAPAQAPPPPQSFQTTPAPKSLPEQEPSDGSTDRVDDLLRQFRERYGKS